MGFLRLILAIAVVIAHSQDVFGLRLTGGMVAVEVFFIISGFYMSMILDRKYTGEGSYKLFLSNRFLRLFPIYWTVLALTIIASVLSLKLTGDGYKLSSYLEYIDVLTVETLFFQVFTNIALFGQDVVMFLGLNPETGGMYFTPDFGKSSPMLYTFLFVPQAWTLGIELMFYLIAPFLVRRKNFVIISLIAISLAIRIFTYSIGYTNDPWTYRFFPSELALFLLGTVSYRLYDIYKIQEYKIFNINPSPVIQVLLLAIIMLYQFIPRDLLFIGFGHVINWIFYGLVCLSIPFIFCYSKSSKMDSRVGELSYPVYISHMLVIGSLSPFLSLLGWNEYQGELAVVFTMLVSYVLVKLIADPIEKIRQSRVHIERKA
jgi:peptidoglycan/LPS O-acetylase OafA/YrhL